MTTLRSLLVLALAGVPSLALAQDETPEPPEAPPPKGPTLEPESPAEAPDRGEAPPPPPPRAARAAAATSLDAPKPRTLRPGAPVAPSPSGQTGLLRVGAAAGGAPGIIRVSLGVEGFSRSGLLEPGDETSRFGGVLGLSGSPIDFLELWLNVRADSHESSATEPRLLQSQGDLQFGAKGFFPVADLASLGVSAQATLLSGIGEAGYDLDATEFRFTGLFSADFTRAPEQFPLRAHLNAGMIFDNSEALADGRDLSLAERFALGVADRDRIALGVGIEVPVPYVTVYAEYTAEIPLDYLATPGVAVVGRGLRPAQVVTEPGNVRARPALTRVVPQRLTPGLRFRPVDGLFVDLAVEIGLTPDQVAGVPVVPDYNVVGLVSYALDPFAVANKEASSGPPVTIPVLLEASRGPRLRGRVLETESRRPVADAVVAVAGAPLSATDAEGRFETSELPPGPATVTVRRAGFRPVEIEIEVADADPEPVEVSLEADVVRRPVRILIVNQANAPIPGAELRLFAEAGPDAATERTAGPDGRVELELAAGEWRLLANAAGFLRTGRRLKIAEDEPPELAMQLIPRGDSGAQVDGEQVVLPEPLPYAKGEIEPNAAVRRGLAWLVDLLLADPTLKVEVAGHTDSRGDDAENQAVSTRRAAAARAFLVEHGVPQTQVVAQGYGSSRPVAPNLTKAGRERNRRVDVSVR